MVKVPDFPLSGDELEEFNRLIIRSDDETFIASLRAAADEFPEGFGTDTLLREAAWRLQTAIECMKRS